MKKLTFITVLTCLMAHSLIFGDNLFADKGYKHNSEGNSLFEKKDFEKSIGEYTRALNLRKDNSLIKYNLANSLVESGQYEDALKTYAEIENNFPEQDKNKLYYNMGNALYKSEKLKEAAEYYKKSLMEKPDDLNAKENLEMCLKIMQQQQQQEQNQDDQNKDKEKQQEEQKQEQQQNDQQKDQKQEQKQQQKPKSQQEKKQENIEKMLKALAEQEKRDKKENDKKKKAAVVDRPVKDW